MMKIVSRVTLEYMIKGIDNMLKWDIFILIVNLTGTLLQV